MFAVIRLLILYKTYISPCHTANKQSQSKVSGSLISCQTKPGQPTMQARLGSTKNSRPID